MVVSKEQFEKSKEETDILFQEVLDNAEIVIQNFQQILAQQNTFLSVVKDLLK